VGNKRGLARFRWLAGILGEQIEVLPLAGDASSRSYFRVRAGDVSWVLMDDPQSGRKVQTFLDVRKWMAEAGLGVPGLMAADVEKGFVLLEDFGDMTWAAWLEDGNKPDALLEDAFRQLHLLQSRPPADISLPVFDMARIRRECDLYLDWYLPKVAEHTPSETERRSFYGILLPHLEKIVRLPKVPVHLDYHSRNLMLPGGGLPLGVIDFQDAVTGPVTYDLASLLYDCYQNYPESERRYWSRLFYKELPTSLADHFSGFAVWHHALRLTALQRHIKAIGIFARLAYRDGKARFLGEIPLTRKHLFDELEFLGISRQQLPLLGFG
jgi:hypothetical protein